MNLSEVRIVADSSSDVFSLEDVDFHSVPLKIITSEKEYVDSANLDVVGMVNDLQTYKGRSSTACPAPGDYIGAFEGAKYVFCVTITSGLSGSYNSATVAKNTYESENPEARVFVIDSLSAGPELSLIIHKLRELILAGEDFDSVCHKITGYMNKTGLLFILESMRNLANNGRVNPFVAKAAGILGIRAVGRASDVGTLELLQKSRGEKKAFAEIISNLKKFGYNCGRIRISHCCNEQGAKTLKELIVSYFRDALVEIGPAGGLCSFYAEKGGLLIGFEKGM